MMQILPLMDIRFPSRTETDLLDAMKRRATVPWQWQAHDAFGRRPEPGHFYFHRDRRDLEPPCTLCMSREDSGHLVVRAIVPDANTVHQIPHEQYMRILREFDQLIASPAADGLEGMTSIGTDRHTLEDHFSPEAIRLLETFCTTSNASDYGTHPCDQEKWIAFLLYVHSNGEEVRCDTFGACLSAKGWWFEDGIPSLVHEFDFAMTLLRQRDR